MKQLSILLCLFLAIGQCWAADEGDDPSDQVAAVSKKKAAAVNHASGAIVYKPANVKAVVTIFTDLDCAYCKKQHEETAAAVEQGIEIRYLAYPRRGKGSSTYNRMVSVWCSKDKAAALSEAMEGGSVAVKTCKHPIDSQYAYGRKLGIAGTPTIIFEDGTIYGGYLSADRLVREAIKHSS